MEAPVLGDLPRLPTPFGTLLYTSPYFTQLSVEDRISALPLAIDLLKYNATKESYLEYDDKSARDVFLGDPTNGRLGASEALYAQFLAPILCALMPPRPRNSPRAALDVLYRYVLAHQDDFDVRWQRNNRGGDLHAVGGEDAGVWATGRAARGQAGDGGARRTGASPRGPRAPRR